MNTEAMDLNNSTNLDTVQRAYALGGIAARLDINGGTLTREDFAEILRSASEFTL